MGIADQINDALPLRDQFEKLNSFLKEQTINEHKTQPEIVKTIQPYAKLDWKDVDFSSVEVLEQLIHLIYVEWFVNYRYPGSLHEKIKMVDSGTDFGKIPMGWEIKSIGEKITILKGKNINQKHYFGW